MVIELTFSVLGTIKRLDRDQLTKSQRILYVIHSFLLFADQDTHHARFWDHQADRLTKSQRFLVCARLRPSFFHDLLNRGKLLVIVVRAIRWTEFSQIFADKAFLDVGEGVFGVFMISDFASTYLSASL